VAAAGAGDEQSAESGTEGSVTMSAGLGVAFEAYFVRPGARQGNRLLGESSNRPSNISAARRPKASPMRRT